MKRSHVVLPKRFATSLAAFGLIAARAFAQCPSQLLLHADAAVSDAFGTSVAVSGDVLAVGVPGDDDVGGSGQGSVRVYRWRSDGWESPLTLLASDAVAFDAFGTSIAAYGRWIAVGATGVDLPGASAAGAVYIFEWTGTAWVQRQKLTLAAPVASDGFGASVGLHGTRLVVGGPGVDVGGRLSQGAAYVYRHSSTGWTLEATLSAADGLAGDTFGEDVDIFDDRIVVGSDDSDIGGESSVGAAYVFRRTGATWAQEQKLVASDGNPNDNFGDAVAIDDGVIAIGSYQADDAAGANQGAVYLYRFNTSTVVWEQRDKILAIDAAAGDNFGSGVDLDGGLLMIGSASDDVVGVAGTNHGSMHLYRWTFTPPNRPLLVFTPPGVAASDVVGEAVALSSQFIALGVPGDDDTIGTSQGSVTTLDTHRFLPHNHGTPVTPDEIVAQDTDTDASLGRAVAVSQFGRVVVGAPLTSYPGVADAGAIAFYRIGAYGLRAPEFFPQPTPVANASFGAQVGVNGSSVIVSAPGERKLYRYSFNSTTLNTPPTEFVGPAATGFGQAMALSDSGTVVVGATGGDSGRGEVYVYTGSAFSLQQQIASPDAAAGAQNFGVAVAISGESMIVGDNQISDGAATGEGAAYVLLRTGTTWALQQKLNLPGANVTNAGFGRSVAISGDRAVIGSRVSSSTSEIHIFDRVGTVWTFTQTIGGLAADAVAAIDGDLIAIADGNGTQGGMYRRFGNLWYRSPASFTPTQSGDFFAVSIRANVAVFGSFSSSAFTADLDSLFIPGCASLVDIFPSGEPFSTISGATGAAVAGESVYASTASLESGASTSDGSPGAQIRGPVRVERFATLSLGDNSTMSCANPESRGVALFGNLGASFANAGLLSASFDRTFETGIASNISVQSGAALRLFGEKLLFNGNVDVDPGGTLIAYGDAFGGTQYKFDNHGRITLGGVLSVDDPFETDPDRETILLNASDGTIQAYGDIVGHLENDGLFSIVGDLILDGNFTNTGQTVIQNGVLGVLGAFSNTGTIIGDCPACRDNLGLFAAVGLSLDSGGSMQFPDTYALLTCGGDFDCAINDNARYDMTSAILSMFATEGSHTLEVMSRDIGPSQDGLDRTISGHYPIRELRVSSLTPVMLVDAHDNDGHGQTACEAIYVETLTIAAHASLINPTCKIYYTALDNRGTVSNLENLIEIVPACPEDIDGDGAIGLTDLALLLISFGGPGGPQNGDIDGDGFVGLTDLALVLSRFGTLCP